MPALAAVAARQQAHRAFDPESGILDIRRATAAHIALARDRGATILAGAESPRSPSRGRRRVHRRGQDYSADRLVLAGGAWNPVLLAMLGAICRSPSPRSRSPTSPRPRSPNSPRTGSASTAIAEDGLYYGFPSMERSPSSRRRRCRAGSPRRAAPSPGRTGRAVRASSNATCPQPSGPSCTPAPAAMTSHETGTSSPTTCPGRARPGLRGAGHAGKFAALLGRILTELALDGSSRSRSAPSAPTAAITGAVQAPARANSM